MSVLSVAPKKVSEEERRSRAYFGGRAPDPALLAPSERTAVVVFGDRELESRLPLVAGHRLLTGEPARKTQFSYSDA